MTDITPVAFHQGNSPRPRGAQLDKRRADALALRHQQFSPEQIGLKLHADPDMVENKERWPDGYPGGYGWKNYRLGRDPLSGSALAHAVTHDIRTQVRTARLACESMRQEQVQLELMTLQTAAGALWHKVMSGDARAHEVWLQNQKLQIDLQGLMPADQVDVSVTVGGDISVQPSFSPEYMLEMFGALVTLGAVPSNATLPMLEAAAQDTDTDAEVTDAVLVE